MTDRSVTVLHMLEEDIETLPGALSDGMLAPYADSDVLGALSPDEIEWLRESFRNNLPHAQRVARESKIGTDDALRSGPDTQALLRSVARDISRTSQLDDATKTRLLSLCDFVPIDCDKLERGEPG